MVVVLVLLLQVLEVEGLLFPPQRNWETHGRGCEAQRLSLLFFLARRADGVH